MAAVATNNKKTPLDDGQDNDDVLAGGESDGDDEPTGFEKGSDEEAKAKAARREARVCF